MKQSLSTRITVLVASFVVTGVVFETVGGLGQPAAEAQVQIAQAHVQAQVSAIAPQ